jgi:hypothetical protein
MAINLPLHLLAPQDALRVHTPCTIDDRDNRRFGSHAAADSENAEKAQHEIVVHMDARRAP